MTHLETEEKNTQRKETPEKDIDEMAFEISRKLEKITDFDDLDSLFSE